MRPYLRAANVTWTGLALDDVKAMNFGPEDAKNFELRPGDIVLNEASGSAGEVGKPAVWRGEIPGCCFQNTLLRVRSCGLRVEYLYWYFHHAARQGQFGEAGRGVNIRHIGKQGLGQFPVPVAPVAEQSRIVAAIEEYVSQLDAASVSLRSSLTRVDALRRAAITDVLLAECWPVKQWADVGQSLSGKTFPSGAYAEGGVRLLRPGNLHRSGAVTWPSQATRYLPPTFAEENPRYMIKGVHLLMNLTAQSLADDFLGRVCLSSSADCFLLNQRIAKLSSAIASDRYLFWVFRSHIFRDFVARLNTGSLIQHISTRHLKPFSFPVPPVSEQARLVDEIERRVAAIDRLADELITNERRSHSLRRSVLAAAFTGRLVCQDPDDEPASELLERIRADRAAAPTRKNRKTVVV